MEPVEKSQPTLLQHFEQGQDDCLSQDTAMGLEDTGLVCLTDILPGDGIYNT